MGAFVISRRFNDEYKFVFTSRKGKVIFTSLSYELKFECEEDIEKFKINTEQAKFLKFKGSGGKYFFTSFMNYDSFTGLFGAFIKRIPKLQVPATSLSQMAFFRSLT